MNIQNIFQVLTKNIFKWRCGIYRNNPSKMDRFSRKSPPETFFTLDTKIKIKCLLLGELRWLFFLKCSWDYALQGYICQTSRICSIKKIFCSTYNFYYFWGLKNRGKTLILSQCDHFFQKRLMKCQVHSSSIQKNETWRNMGTFLFIFKIMLMRRYNPKYKKAQNWIF